MSIFLSESVFSVLILPLKLKIDCALCPLSDGQFIIKLDLLLSLK